MIKTDRLVLRPLDERDVAASVAGLNDPEIVRFLTRVPSPYSVDDARGWIATRPYPTPGKAHFAIDLPGSGMIGSVALDIELGFWLTRAYQGRGYTTEASAALLRWHFAALPDDVVRSGAHVGNIPSLSVQRKLGFAEVSRSRRYSVSLGREVDHIETTVNAIAFEAAQARRVGLAILQTKSDTPV